MSLELQNCIIIIDSREKSEVRIKAVESWAIAKGAIVEHHKLDHGDYAIIGEFHDVPVSLNVQVKGGNMADFCSSDYQDIKNKLFTTLDYYDTAALFIVAGNFTYKPNEKGIMMINNSNVQDGSANVCPLSRYEGCFSTLPLYGIHVRSLRGEAQVPDSIHNLLTYITEPEHYLIKRTTKDFMRRYKQTLLAFVTPLQMKKLIVSYPNLSWLCSASEESYKQILGAKTGSNLYAFIRCHELESNEWRNNYHMDGTEKDTVCIDEAHPNHKLYKISLSLPEDYSKNGHDTTSIPQSSGSDIISSHEVGGFPKSFHGESQPLTSDTSQSLSRIDATKFAAPAHDTSSSHPGCSLLSVVKPDDPQSSPPKELKSEEKQKQERLEVISSPVHSDIGLDDKLLESVIKCRACHQIIIPEKDNDTGFCREPKCIAERKKPKYKMSVDVILEEFMADNKPHTLDDIQEHCKGCGTPYIFDRVMANVKSGNIKKVTEQSGRTTFQKVN